MNSGYTVLCGDSRQNYRIHNFFLELTKVDIKKYRFPTSTDTQRSKRIGICFSAGNGTETSMNNKQMFYRATPTATAACEQSRFGYRRSVIGLGSTLQTHFKVVLMVLAHTPPLARNKTVSHSLRIQNKSRERSVSTPFLAICISDINVN